MTRIAIAFLLAFLALPAAAERRTEELMRLSSINAQLGQVNRKVQAKLIESAEASGAPGERIRPTDAEKVAIALAEAFQGDRLRITVLSELRGRLSAEDEEQALRWLHTGNGRRITAAEVRTIEAGGVERFPALAKSSLTTASSYRRALFNRIAMATSAGESGADMVINMMSAIVSGAAPFMTPPDSEAGTRMRRRLTYDRPQMVLALREQAMAGFAYTYRELPDGDLEDYIAFLESSAGTRYSLATRKALDRAFTQAALDVGRVGADAFSNGGKMPF